jgi:chromosome segregation ATPase
MTSRRSNNKEEESQDDGAVWTSYSDMFTTIAIIFLVMFVFALIKAGISSMKVAQQNIEHKEMLEGKIPKKIAKENLNKKKEIDKSIREMDQYNEMISEKVKELNSFSKKMNKHKKVMANLLKDQEIKTVVMENMKIVINDKKKIIREVKDEIRGLKKNIAKKEEIIKIKNIENKNITIAKIKIGNEIKKLQRNLFKTEQELKESRKIDIVNQENSVIKEETIKKLEQKILKLDKIVSTRKETIRELESTQNINKKQIKHQDALINETSIKLTRSEEESGKLIKKTSNLEAQIKEKITHNNALKKTIKNIDKTIHTLESKGSKLKKQMSNLNSKNKNLGQKLSVIKSEMSYLKKDLQTAQNSNSGLQRNLTYEKSHSHDLETKVKGLKAKVSNLGNELKSSKGESVGKSKEIDKLKGILGRSGKANKSLESTIDGLKAELKGSDKNNTKLKGNLSKIKEESKMANTELLKLKEKVLKLEKSLSKSNGRFLAIKNENFKNLKNLKKLESGIAHVGKRLRSTIAKKIAKKLKMNDLNVEVNKETGSIILRMDDTFLFKRNDYLLSSKAKNSLKRIIPIYTEELFKDPTVREYISQVHVIGHASPRYMKDYVSPDDTNNFTAYQFNMDLSTNRAKEIVKYIFSKSFGDFPYRQEFRRIVSSVGKSFSSPVRIGRGLASRPNVKQCGRYDCRLSRRVEISFTLNESASLYKKLKSLHVAK